MAKFSPSSAAAESKNCLPLVPKGRWHGEAMPEGIRPPTPRRGQCPHRPARTVPVGVDLRSTRCTALVGAHDICARSKPGQDPRDPRTCSGRIYNPPLQPRIKFTRRGGIYGRPFQFPSEKRTFTRKEETRNEKNHPENPPLGAGSNPPAARLPPGSAGVCCCSYGHRRENNVQ